MGTFQQPTIGVGSIIRHKRFNCKVVRFTHDYVVVKRVNGGLVLHVPYPQMPHTSIA